MILSRCYKIGHRILRRNIVLVTIAIVFISGSASSQDFYKDNLNLGIKSFKDENYYKAIKYFDLAKEYIERNDSTKLKEIEKWNDTTIFSMEKLVTDLISEKSISYQARDNAEKQREIAEASLARTKKIINAFYFYEEMYALAYKNNMYGFINKKGEVVIDYKYEEAAPFDYTGLARVKRVNLFYLIDNKKNEYQLSTNTIVSPSTLALDLSNQQLSDFPESILNATQLNILLINGNELRQIPPSISKLQNLTRFYIYNNDLKSLPPSIGELSNLQLLDASINGLTELPVELYQLSKLTDLILYDNSLTDLHDTIGELRKLFFLDLSKNLLQGLPQGFGELKNLKILALSDNQLEEVPLVLKELSDLKMIDLGGNQLSTIPGWVGNFDSLTHLHIRNNELTQLPDSLQNLDSLKEFIADHNILTGLPNSFKKLKNLKILDLSYNKLHTVPEEILELPQLTDLYLIGNSIDSLPTELTQLTNLRKVDLSNNLLINLPENVHGVENLEELVLMNNKLTHLPKGISNMPSLKTLDIRENQDMEFAESMRHMDSAKKQIIISAGNYNLGYLVEDNRLLIKVDRLSSLPEELTGLQKLVLLDLANCISLTAGEIESTFKVYQRKINYMNNEFPQINDTNNLAINVDLPVLLELDPVQLKARTDLSLSSQSLSYLPIEIGLLTNLETLDLSLNSLKTLPQEIGNLIRLKKLILDGNDLSTLPEELKKLENLKILSIKNNPITLETIEIIKEWLPNCVIEKGEGL